MKFPHCVCPAIHLKLRNGPFFESDPRLLFKKNSELTNPFSFFSSLSLAAPIDDHMKMQGPILQAPVVTPAPTRPAWVI